MIDCNTHKNINLTTVNNYTEMLTAWTDYMLSTSAKVNRPMLSLKYFVTFTDLIISGQESHTGILWKSLLIYCSVCLLLCNKLFQNSLPENKTMLHLSSVCWLGIWLSWLIFLLCLGLSGMWLTSVKWWWLGWLWPKMFYLYAWCLCEWLEVCGQLDTPLSR